MIKNFQELVLQIKEQIPIQELISEYIQLKRSGKGYVGLCPFHDDHHPSLQIHSSKGIFKCFSCGTGGDIFTFYSLINKKKWSEAVSELALKYGFKIEYGSETKTEVQIKSLLNELNKVTLDFFKRSLFKPNNTDAVNYLTNTRKLSLETIKKFEIGFAENSWDSLYNFLSREKNYPNELLIASGLFILKENQNNYYDRFRNRIIFPIVNENTYLVGFGGRSLPSQVSAHHQDAKYINSPETLIFNKGQVLYGLNFAKDEIKKLDYAILTEGYLDVITSHQNGLINTVGTLGTALSTSQIRLLTKYTDSKKICLCLDTDQAGKKALESIFHTTQEISLYHFVDMRVISNLGSKDLDEALNKEDLNKLREKIENGQQLIFFILDKNIRQYHESSSEAAKKSSLNETLQIATLIKDKITQNEIINYLSHKLSLSEELIKLQLKERIKTEKKVKSPRQNTTEKEDLFKMYLNERFKHAELELLSLYISSFPYKSEIQEEFQNIEFIDEKHKLIKEYLDNLTSTNISPQSVINQLMLDFNEYSHLMSLISELAWRIEVDEANYLRNKKIICKEAKEWINWWITNKQKMKVLTDTLKECKNNEEEKKILTQMLELVRLEQNRKRQEELEHNQSLA